jgi:predicted nucleic acid-binding protein
MTGRVFVDTNVLIYAHDVDAGERHAIASRLFTRLWSERLGLLSTLVLQEFCVHVTRKIASPLPRATARNIVNAYGTWPTIAVTREEIWLPSSKNRID